MSVAGVEIVLVELGSAIFLCGLLHLAWCTHQRLAETEQQATETKEPAPWTPPPPPPGFSVLPWDP
jgi:hypothetical protein